MAPAGVPRGAAAFLGSSAPLSARRAAAAAARLTRSAAPATRAMLAYKEQASGVEFPLVQKLWLGEDMRCVGAGCRSKKVQAGCSGTTVGCLFGMLLLLPRSPSPTCCPPFHSAALRILQTGSNKLNSTASRWCVPSRCTRATIATSAFPCSRTLLQQVAFIGVKVYAVALYVEAEKMARELGVRNR